MSGETSCHMCDLLQSVDGDRLVYREAAWTIAVPVDVPGWMMLIANRHNEGVWDLDAEEAARFGTLSVALTGAVKEVCDPERVYLMYQGENCLHFHAIAAPRGAEIPIEWRGGALMGKSKELSDPDATVRVAAAVRSALADRLR